MMSSDTKNDDKIIEEGYSQETDIIPKDVDFQQTDQDDEEPIAEQPQQKNKNIAEITCEPLQPQQVDRKQETGTELYLNSLPIDNAVEQTTVIPGIYNMEEGDHNVPKKSVASSQRSTATQSGEENDANNSAENKDMRKSSSYYSPKKDIVNSSRRSTATQTPRLSLVDSAFPENPDFSESNDQVKTRNTQTSNSSSSSPIRKYIDSEGGEAGAGGIKDQRPSVYGADHSILPKRHVLLLMMFLGFAVVYSLRVNINVAIVAMVNNRTLITKKGKIVFHIAEFDWDSHTQALVVGSFYYGYWVLQVPGAWIAMKLGATRIFGYGVVLASLMSLLTPVATRYHVYALAGVRMVQGLFLGVTYPCIIAIWAKWAPPLERSTMVTMAIAGSPVGNIIAIPLTGLLSKYGFDGGWPTVFYFFGFLGCMWYIVWECVIYDTPDTHPTITDNERIFITRTIAEKPFDPLTETPPWCAIFTSIPMWGIIFGHFGACWGYYTLFTQMPTYLKDIQHLDIKTMGLVAATPYLFKAFLGPLGGISADMLLRRKIMTIRGVRTFFYAVGCLLAGFFILMVGYYVRATEAIAFLILGVGFSGLNATGYSVNHLDIAPRYAGILMGISNSFATIPGFLSPMITGYITKNKKASEWRIVFWITFIIYVVAVALYTVMCSGEKQWWADGYPKDETKNDSEEEEKEQQEEDIENNDDNELYSLKQSSEPMSEKHETVKPKKSSRGSIGQGSKERLNDGDSSIDSSLKQRKHSDNAVK